MEMVTIDGIDTRFEVIDSGPPILMFSPGGFDSSMENWKSFFNIRKTQSSFSPI